MALVAAFVAAPIIMAVAAPGYATFQMVNWGKITLAVTQANVPEEAKVKIKIVKRAKSELGLGSTPDVSHIFRERN